MPGRTFPEDTELTKTPQHIQFLARRSTGSATCRGRQHQRTRSLFGDQNAEGKQGSRYRQNSVQVIEAGCCEHACKAVQTTITSFKIGGRNFRRWRGLRTSVVSSYGMELQRRMSRAALKKPWCSKYQALIETPQSSY